MNENDERLLRSRVAELSRQLETLSVRPQVSESFVAVTFQLATYPTAANRFYALHPASVAGTEDEGQAATITSRTGVIFALNLGGSIPPQGTQVVVHYVSNRLVFRYT